MFTLPSTAPIEPALSDSAVAPANFSQIDIVELLSATGFDYITKGASRSRRPLLRLHLLGMRKARNGGRRGFSYAPVGEPGITGPRLG